MTTALPSRPDFTHLKHQAKDLLRAHKQRDAGLCRVLRNLRQFESASDAEMFDSPLALSEAQYALAMEYGFASWAALKRYVEKVTGRKDPVRRSRGKTYVTGLESYGIGCKDYHDSSAIAALAGVMHILGEDSLSYEYLMGVSGAAFRVQMHDPGWCPSAACAPCGYNCVDGAVAATGYTIRWTDVRRDGKWLDDGLAAAKDEIAASIDRGAAVIACGIESWLVVGCCDDGKLLARPYEFHEDGYKDLELFDEAGKLSSLEVVAELGEMLWSFGFVELRDVPSDRRQAVIDSLRLAVKLARTQRFGQYLSGFAALESWIDGLLDDSRFENLTEDNWFPMAHANGYCYPCFWSARINAEKYLRVIADEFEESDESVKAKLLEIASLYQQVHQMLNKTAPEFECVWSLMPWMLKFPDNWTRQLREKQAALLSDSLTLERRAVEKIEALLVDLE